MRVMKEITRPTITETICDKVLCDICGAEGTDFDWSSGYYELEQTKIKMSISCRTGESYPEGGWTDEWLVDMCPKCFKEKFVPWLNEQGANIKPRRCDF